jgi:hypothetical protein
MKLSSPVYKGISVRSYYSKQGIDPELQGFPMPGGTTSGWSTIIRHIARNPVLTPYMSFTLSFPVAATYAGPGGKVYELDPYQCDLNGVQFLDPIREIAVHSPNLAHSHNGTLDLVPAIMVPAHFPQVLVTPVPLPPGSNPPAPSPHVTDALRALAFAIRDAEVLARTPIPRACVAMVHNIR